MRLVLGADKGAIVSRTTKEQRAKWLATPTSHPALALYEAPTVQDAIDLCADLEDAERKRDLLEKFVQLEGKKHDAFINEMKVFVTRYTLVIAALERCSRERKARWLNDVLAKVRA